MTSTDPIDPVSESSEKEPVSEFGAILSAFENTHHSAPRSDVGNAVEGTIISVTPDAVYIDVGRKIEGVIAATEFRDREGKSTVKPGDAIYVSITGRTEEGLYSLSRVHVARPKDWTSLERAFADKSIIGGVVTEVVKGGLRVDVGAAAFMPASRSGARDLAEMEKLVGQEIRCRVTKLDTASEDVVVDRRVVLEEEASQARERTFASLQEGAVVRGSVRTLTDFGAFVDLGGVDGLLHIADMAWHRVAKPTDILSAGDSLDVKILKVNPETRKVSVGLKQLQPDPWALVAEKYTPGERVRGKVVRVADYGAFVELEPGIDGLIHLSEMAWSKVKRVSDVVKPGDQVEVVVLEVKPAEKRVSLGLKQALGDPWEDADKRYPVGSVAEGKVVTLTKFGAFVNLSDGFEGMIHIGDITSEKRLNHPREVLAEGQPVRAKVLELDRQRRRIRLGLKQLEPTMADQFINEHKPGDTTPGRVVEVASGEARVELGEGVAATCRLETAQSAANRANPIPSADLGSLTAMLAAKWKGSGSAAGIPNEAVRVGQIRKFRILSMDAADRRIEVELAD